MITASGISASQRVSDGSVVHTHLKTILQHFILLGLNFTFSRLPFKETVQNGICNYILKGTGNKMYN